MAVDPVHSGSGARLSASEPLKMPRAELDPVPVLGQRLEVAIRNSLLRYA